eukprot:Phypoly_transcript_00556.p1 GENE.Phypoly_transcript_00556~~Phypoly_transcript_00556.p1  ORF type:complete len:1385 (+),score=255.41 Phypoly_transcript_00556:292-4446(+)
MMASSSLERKRSFKQKGKKSNDYFSVGAKDEYDLPTFFIYCVNHLEEHALDEEGILRIHGRTQDTNAINAFLSSGNANEKRTTTLGQVDPHAVATLLKSYLNRGPPLLPMDHYSTFVDIGSKKEVNGEVLLLFREVIGEIPISYQRVLHRVLIFIDNVQQHSAKNKMDTKALAIIFNPLLVRAPTEVSPAQILSQTQSCINCVLLLITNYQAIFEGMGLNYFESPASPSMSGRDGTLRDFSTASISKDKVKIRFLFYFTVKTGGGIQDTVSLFLKYAKQGVKQIRRETGQTRALVCTNPQEVVWEEVVPLEVTLVVNKRTKAFDPRNFIVTLKCVTQKTSKTLGAASINLAELAPPTLSTSPRDEVKTYEMLHKGGKSKSMVLIVKCFSEWRKVNNKLVVRQEESGNTLRRGAISLHSEDSSRYDDPQSRFAAMRGKAALMSMPNLNNLEIPPRSDKAEDERYPLSARDQVYKSESNLLTPTKAPESPFTSATSSPAASPTLSTIPISPPYAPTTPASLDGIPAPDFGSLVVAAAPTHITPPGEHDTAQNGIGPTPDLGPSPAPSQDSSTNTSPIITGPASDSIPTLGHYPSIELSPRLSPTLDPSPSPSLGPTPDPSPSHSLGTDATHQVQQENLPTSTASETKPTENENTPTPNDISHPGNNGASIVATTEAKSDDAPDQEEQHEDNTTQDNNTAPPTQEIVDSVQENDAHENEKNPLPDEIRDIYEGLSLRGSVALRVSAALRERTSAESDEGSKERRREERKRRDERSKSKERNERNKSEKRKSDEKNKNEERNRSKREERSKSAERSKDRTERNKSTPERNGTKRSERSKSEERNKSEERKKEEGRSAEEESKRERRNNRRERTHSHSKTLRRHERPEKTPEKRVESEESKSDTPAADATSSAHNHTEPNGAMSSIRHQIPTSPEIHTPVPVRREKRPTLSELNIPGIEPTTRPRVSPTLAVVDDTNESDLESDPDFDGVNSAYAQKMFELTEQIELLEQQRRQLELETFNLRKCLVHNEIYRPQTLDFSERGISSTAEQIIENLLKMNCFLEPHNFLPSFFDSIIISLQQESKNEVEAPKILYWLSTTLGLLYLLSMSIKSIPDPSVHGVVALTHPIQKSENGAHEESEKSNENLLHFARGIQRTALELYHRVLKLFEKQLDEDKLVLAFLGRPKEKEEKPNFVITAKPSGVKTPDPVLTPSAALKEVLREINENYQLLKDAKIFENFAWHLALHRLFYLDHLLVHELSVQKKLYSTDAQTIKQATSEIEKRIHEKFPEQSSPCPLKMTTQFVTLVTAEFSKLDSETYINNAFTLLKPSQILQILEVLRPDKDSRKPVPASVQKVLQAMAKSEGDRPRIVPMTWHLSDEIAKLTQAVH